MDHLSISQKISDLLLERIQIEVSSPDEDIVELGLLDSLGLVELMSSLEETFDIHITFEEIEIDNFRSVRRITEFVISQLSVEKPVFF
jgi:D-alanine--poly(phosphoribitol) ligase subunit 2